MKRLSVIGIVALALVACSSSPTMTERVKDTEKAMAKADKILNKAQSEMTDFTNQLGDLKEDAADGIPMARSNRFNSSLDRLRLAVQQAQLDMKELQVSNQEKRQVFESRVNQAMQSGATVPEEPIYEAD